MLRKRITRATILFGVAWLLTAPVGPEALAAGEVVRLRVVPEETRIDFVNGYSFLSHHLKIGGEITGRLNVRSGDAGAALTDPIRWVWVEIVIDPRSLDTGNRWRDEVLRKEYLDVEKYPEIRVRLTRVTDVRGPLSAREGRDQSLEGRLTLHGVTREVVAKARGVSKDRRVAVDGETTVQMTSFGMKLPELPPFLRARDEVNVRFHVVLERHEEE